MSDRHATLLTVVPSVMPTTDQLLCIHHLKSNIYQHLRTLLGAHEWPPFQDMFWDMFRATLFFARFPSTRAYLAEEIYPSRQQWAHAHTFFKFTCGVRTNGRVESENRVTKALGNSSTSPFQLFTGLNERTNGQSVQEMIKLRDSSRRQHPGQLETLFAGVLQLVRAHGGPFAVQQCYKQMELSLFFMTEVLQLPEGVRSWNMINSFTNEDAYLGLEWLLRLIIGRGHQILHLLRVTHRASGRQHMLAILEDNNYVCDCAMGMNLGIPCRHYFQVLMYVRDLRFHLGVIRRR
ncbi:hypothetical protein FA13DRAFT_1758588 [Coprinellus micaceus]|uniref:SWIM-type domain-containing protein n=1 Tax=Coprinellus micaceus TaxID=71717 RepID=A0A4Y7SA83_COPMI|nr:hypothetical protein FA13DRAFT_1758588 [Coprinellus micaceus]